MPKATNELTPYQKRIHDLLLTALSVNEIACTLKISKASVDNARARIYVKLMIFSREQLMRREIERCYAIMRAANLEP